ncbi:MAG: cytochrome [Rariglobus sp.]|jgi:cytochrome P450|nr:cytochrome [Rariglobus sp.]
MSNSRAPSPAALPVLGHALAFKRDPLGFLQKTARDQGPVARLRLGPLLYHLVSDPALVATVLQDRADRYVRDTRSSRNIRLVTGEGLLCCEGDTWRRHRRLAQPIFHHRRIMALAEIMLRTCEESASRYASAADSSQPLDLASEMSRLTFTIVGRCLFGSELGPRATDVEQAFPVLLEELFNRAQSAVSLPIWLPTPAHRRFQRAIATVDDVVRTVLDERRGATADRPDLLSLLLEARDEDGSRLSEQEVRDHIVTFLLAGHETTASALTWTLCLLATHADTLHAVEAELDATLHGQPLTLDALPKLTHLDAVLRESLRLYPTIWIAERRVTQDDTLGGFDIPAGSTVVISPYVTQRLASHWLDPDAFRPDRFLGDRATRTLAKDGYFPFGAGPHQCIGQHFAMMEAKIALASLLSRFRVHLADEKLPPAWAGITLRPQSTVPIRLTRR